MHKMLLKRFQYYLLIGGLPDAVNCYLEDRNMVRVRAVHGNIHELYRIDASQYDEEHKLKIRRIYDLIPSNLENRIMASTEPSFFQRKEGLPKAGHHLYARLLLHVSQAQP